MIHYLFIGFGFWLSSSILRRHTFKDATPIAVIKGVILGILFWPALVFLIWDANDNTN